MNIVDPYFPSDLSLDLKWYIEEGLIHALLSFWLGLLYLNDLFGSELVVELMVLATKLINVMMKTMKGSNSGREQES